MFEVYALDLERGSSVRLTDRPEGTGYRVTSRPTPDGAEVWWWDDDRGNELGVWRRQPFEGGPAAAATDLGPAYSAGLALGDGVAVVGTSTAQGSRVHVVSAAGTRQIYAHAESAGLGTLSRDGRLAVLLHSEHGDSRNRALRVIDLAGRTVHELWDGPGRGLQAGRWSPVAGDSRLIVLHERRGVMRPMLLDASSGAERDLAIELEGESVADWGPDGSWLLITHERRGRDELYRYDLAADRAERLDAPAGAIGPARVRPDGEVWLAVSESSRPRAVRRMDGSLVLPPAIAEVPAGRRYRDVDVTLAGATPDQPIHSFVVAPDRPGPHPTILIVHGGPEAHDTDSFSPRVQAWVDHGYAVALVNYRGSSGYGKAWRDAIKGRPGLTELADIAAVHDRLVADGVADARRSIISGGSWGGYLTLLGLGVQPERWALGIASVPIGDYVAAFEDEMEPLKRYDIALFGGTPDELPDLYRERNPITFVDQVRAPVLLLIGRNDPRCPARSADLYVDRLVARGHPHERYDYEAGHGSLRLEETLRQVALELDFAARHLGTTPVMA